MLGSIRYRQDPPRLLISWASATIEPERDDILMTHASCDEKRVDGAMLTCEFHRSVIVVSCVPWSHAGSAEDNMQALSTKPSIHPTADLLDSTLGAYTEVGARTRLLEVSMGDYSYVVNDSDIAYATIGKFCSIAAMTRINPGNHPMRRASQSHFTYRASAYFAGERDEDEFFAWRRAHAVVIGHDVWIGHAAIVLPGRNIGTGAVIAAGAVVTKDVAPYAIVAGNPARVIRQRFPAVVAERLQRMAWWNWSHERLRDALPDLRRLTVEDFLDRYAMVEA